MSEDGRSHRDTRGLTLIELLMALGIMAFGSSVALGLLTMATTTHRRAIDRTNSALLASAVIADLRGELTTTLDATTLAAHETGATTVYFARGARRDGYPDYLYDVRLTPLGESTLEDADAFHAEVVIRWKAGGRPRVATYHTVVRRRVAVRDL